MTSFQPIVEGHSEVSAVPVLLRRLLTDAEVCGITIAKPHRRRRNELTNKDKLQDAVRVALGKEPAGILILFDADDDCPKEIAPLVAEWAREAAHSTPCVVVMANREYEAWFLASIESLRGTRGILLDAVPHPDPEAPRNAKGELRRRMDQGRSYSPTADQTGLTAGFDFGIAYRHCRSFRKFVSAVGVLLEASQVVHDTWPPESCRR